MAEEAPGQGEVVEEERGAAAYQVVGDVGLCQMAVGADHSAVSRGVALG